MKESKDRTEQFMSSTSAAASQAPTSKFSNLLLKGSPFYRTQLSDSLLFGGPRSNDPTGDGSASRTDLKGKGRARPNGDVIAMDLLAAEEGSNAKGPFAQMQLVEQQVINFFVLSAIIELF